MVQGATGGYDHVDQFAFDELDDHAPGTGGHDAGREREEGEAFLILHHLFHDVDGVSLVHVRIP